MLILTPQYVRTRLLHMRCLPVAVVVVVAQPNTTSIESYSALKPLCDALFVTTLISVLLIELFE